MFGLRERDVRAVEPFPRGPYAPAVRVAFQLSSIPTPRPSPMKTLFPALLFSLLALASCGSDSGGKAPALRFCAIPDQNATELEAKYGQVADYLAQELGVEVEFVPTADYGASVDAFRNGDVQLAWFGGLTGVRARSYVPGARAIAQGKVDPLFYSYFIANASTRIEPGDDFPMALKGHTFTFGSESSTSGRLMPEYFIREATGMSPTEFFAGEEMNFSGSHDKTALLVAEGTFDAGVLNYKVYDAMVAEGKIDPEVCRVIWKTPTYPDYNWTAHPILEEEFGAGFTDRLQAALVGIHDPALLEALQRPEGMIPAANEDFAPLAELAKTLGLLR